MSNRLDSRSLALFVAVAETFSFRRASERVHLSQPPLSRAIRDLEDRLGTPLFERDTRGVALTPAGSELLPRARRILALLAQAESAVVAESTPARLRLGFSDAIEASRFARVLTRMQKARADVEVVGVVDTSSRLVRALRTHRLDAAFVALPIDPFGLQVDPLEQQPMMVALASSHRLARKRTIRLSDLDGEAVFRLERARQPVFFDRCQVVFAKHGATFRAVTDVADHPALLGEVAAGRVIALLPESFSVLARRGVGYRALREGMELALGVALATHEDATDLREPLMKAAR